MERSRAVRIWTTVLFTAAAPNRCPRALRIRHFTVPPGDPCPASPTHPGGA
jgi:hypothetical protein